MRSYREGYIIRKIEQLEDDIELCKQSRNKGFGIFGFYTLNLLSLPSINAAYQYYSSGKLEPYTTHLKESILPFLPTEAIAAVGIGFGIAKIKMSNNKKLEYENKKEELERYLLDEY